MAKFSEEELIKLQKKYTTDAAIGELVGISRQAVQQLRKKYGIEARTVDTQPRNEQIIQLHSQGKSVNIIAKKYDLSIQQIYKIIRVSKSLH